MLGTINWPAKALWAVGLALLYLSSLSDAESGWDWGVFAIGLALLIGGMVWDLRR